jgi:mRNA interferase MazF
MVTGPVPKRGEIWYAQLDKQRPVVVMHRNFAGRHLHAVLAAPVTTTIRGIPTEVPLGIAHGLDRQCVASLDNLTLVERRLLREKIGQVDDYTMAGLCRALGVVVACAIK